MNILDKLKERVTPAMDKLMGPKTSATNKGNNEEKITHVDSKIVSTVVNIWTFYTDKFLTGNASADWMDISKKGQDILRLQIKAQNDFRLNIVLYLNDLIGVDSKNLEKRTLVLIATEILGLIKSAEVKESGQMSFAYDMNLETEDSVDKLHADEKYLLSLAQALYLISEDKSFIKHIDKSDFVKGIDLRDQQDSLATWRRLLGDLKMQELRTTDQWLTIYNEEKRLVRIKFNAMRPNGLTKLTVCLYSDDFKSDNISKLLKTRLKEQLQNIEYNILANNKDDYSPEDQQRLLDDAQFFNSLKEKL